MDSVRLVVEPHAPECLKHVVRDRLDLYNVAVTGMKYFLRKRLAGDA